MIFPKIVKTVRHTFCLLSCTEQSTNMKLNSIISKMEIALPNLANIHTVHLFTYVKVFWKVCEYTNIMNCYYFIYTLFLFEIFVLNFSTQGQLGVY